MMAVSGPRRAAIAILSLDEELAASVLAQMSELDLKRLTIAVDELGEVSADAIVGVLDALDRELTDPLARVRADGAAYVRRLAGRAFGEDRARKLLAAPVVQHTSPLELLRTARVNLLADLLGEEHPQIAAVVMSQLSPRVAARIAAMMPPDQAADLVARMSGLEDIPQHAVAEASESLVRALEAAGGLASSDHRAEFDGLAFAASVVNEMAIDAGDELLGRIAERDQTAATRIREAMFTFEDLVRIPTRETANLLREIQSETLVTALQTATPEIAEHFLGALSLRAAATLRDDIAASQPRRVSEVESAQREIVEAATRLAADGKLTLPSRGGEDP